MAPIGVLEHCSANFPDNVQKFPGHWLQPFKMLRQQYATSFSPKKSKFTLFSMCQQTYFHIQFELLINFNQLVHVPENQAINQVYTCAPEIEPINLASPILLVVQGVNVKLFKFLTVSHRFMKGCNWHAFQKILKFAFLEITLPSE